MKTFGERLRVLRNSTGKSQKEFGKIFNLSESTIGMYERNERKPDYGTLEKLANHFSKTTDYLLYGKDKAGIDSDEKGFQEFLNDPNLGLWFKELKDSPEEQVDELRKIWEIIKSRETGRMPGDRQK